MTQDEWTRRATEQLACLYSYSIEEAREDLPASLIEPVAGTTPEAAVDDWFYDLLTEACEPA